MKTFFGYKISLPLLFFLLFGCRTSQLPTKPFSNQIPVHYTFIYLIHGDANYLYHNREGIPLQADKQVLEEAKRIAENAENGEVFIFHLKPETQIFWIFPRKDRHFLYYRNGKLIYEKNYSPHSKKQPFVTEAKLYRYFHQGKQKDSSGEKILLYFGHEIPTRTGMAYFQSRPNAQFNTALFAKGLDKFLPSETEQFDLTVLSTCANGTPKMVHALAPTTDYLLASPQNLHLSHIDTKALQLMDKPGEISDAKLASKIATDTYKRLSSFLQTVISLSVYHTDEMNEYLPELAKRYEAYLKQHSYATPSVQNIDCNRLPFFNSKKAATGVKVWYRPPQFGRKAGNENHSGWGCKQ